MNRDEIYPDGRPSPDQFAAFLDGELEADAHTRVEAWLGQHPADAEEIDGQRELLRLWHATVPMQPSPKAWAAALDRIEARVRPARRRFRALRRTLWLTAALAAALLFAVLLTRLFQADSGKITPPKIAARTSLERGDPEPILLASQDDVSIVNIEPYGKDDGRVPAIGEGDVSMIVAAPLGGEP